MNSVMRLMMTATLPLVLSNCIRIGPASPNQPLADLVHIERFMGTWYVQAYTPTLLDRDAHDATESYELSDDGKILTTYRFRKGGPDGSWKTMNPVGWVHDATSNAEWRMRFFGLVTSPYYILFVSPDYSETVIGHPGKELAWIMTRNPEISESAFTGLRAELLSRDYDISKLTRVQHASGNAL